MLLQLLVLINEIYGQYIRFNPFPTDCMSSIVNIQRSHIWTLPYLIQSGAYNNTKPPTTPPVRGCFPVNGNTDVNTKYSFYHLDQSTNRLSLWENCLDSNCNSECIFKNSQDMDNITTNRCSELYVEKVWTLEPWDNQLVHTLHAECPGTSFGTRQV